LNFISLDNNAQILHTKTILMWLGGFMINLLYCGNYKVFDGVLISLLSAVKHTKEAVHTYLLTMDLSDIDENFKPISEEQRTYNFIDSNSLVLDSGLSPGFPM